MTIDKIDYNEALSYLGYHGAAPDKNVFSLLRSYEERLLKVITPRFVFKVFEKERLSILIGSDIAEHLKHSDSVAVFAATIGIGADNLQRTAQINDMTGAVILDALMTAAVEMICDRAESEIAASADIYGSSEIKATSRFSPGYGDFPLEVQASLLRLIDAEKKIGVTLNEGGMMIPSKSVTAVIGLRLKKGQL